MSLNNINLLRVLATSGAIGLVVASAGFGSVYAWNVGAQHSIALAGLSVLMALALEGIKPLAVSSALAAWKRAGERPLALGLTLLAGISVAYSLTAEVSLVSQTKGDQIAERQALATDAGNAARDRSRIEAELQTIGYQRPSRAIQAELDGGVRKSRIAPLKAEKALAERREALEAQLTGVPSLANKEADPASKAMSVYLAALGFAPVPDKVAVWLILIPVLALEIGSALAHVLVQAFPATRGIPTVKEDGLQTTPARVVQSENTGVEPARAKVTAAIVDHLKANGGQVEGGERGLAKLIGSSRGTMKRALNGLVLAGIVSLEASRNGSILRLIS